MKKEIQAEVEAGNMKPITPQHFIISLMSLCSYPFLGRPLIKNIFQLSDEDYRQLITERKDVIMRLLFLDIN